MLIPEERKKISGRLFRISLEEGNHHEEFAFVRQNDGKKLMLSSVWTVWPHTSGKPVKMTGIIRDVTLEREHEKAIRAEKERAIEANFAKSRFLTNMSHEIRTPLNGILGFTDLLLKSELNAEQRSQIELIKSSGDTLLALLSDLLDLSKIEAGKLKLEEKTFNIFEVTEMCIQPYKVQAREEGINLEWDLDTGIPELIEADPVRYRQILVNLLSNAIKYTQEGSIQISIKALEVNPDEDSFVLQGEVTDTGIGIPKADQEDIFTAFGQSSNTTVEEFGGTGLGLAIVSELVRMMDGSIQLKSPVFPKRGAYGSRFTFQLVTKKGKPKTKLSFENTKELFQFLDQKPLAGQMILIAEDNVVNQILAKKVLEDLGAEVAVVENGQEAIEFVKNSKVDIIMMDIKMPVMNGYEATRQIRHFAPNLPIIALSANAYKEDREASLEAGMNGHISKPFLPEELFKAIEKLKPAPYQP